MRPMLEISFAVEGRGRHINALYRSYCYIFSAETRRSGATSNIPSFRTGVSKRITDVRLNCDGPVLKLE